MIAVGVCHNARARARFARAAAGIALAGALAGAFGAGCRAPAAARPTDELVAAEAATRRGDWPRAASLWYERYLASGGRDARACYEAARALFLSGDGPSACALCEEGLLARPGDPDLLELRARIQAEHGFRRAAEDSLAQLVQEHPGRASALLLLGRIRLELGLEEQAVAPLSRATRLLPEDARAWRLLGDACRGAGLSARAFAAYRHAIALGDEDPRTRLRAAELTIEEEVRDFEPRAMELAFQWLAEVIERDPQSSEACFIAGRLCEEAGRVDEAIDHYRRAVEVDLSCLEALTNLAVLYARLGRPEETRRMVERALALETVPRRREALAALVERAEQVARERETAAGSSRDGAADGPNRR